MTKIGIGLPGQSISDVRGAAEAAAPYGFDSFSVYGDLGDLPPYAVLHASASLLEGTGITVGPMGVPIGLQHAEVIGMHALALEEQLPDQSYIGLVRGAFLEAIGETPASSAKLETTVNDLRSRFQEKGKEHISIYIGGLGQRVLGLAGRLAVDGVKLGGSTNPALAEKAKQTINNPQTKIVLGAVSVIDDDRKSARSLARKEVAKYLDVVGSLDTTLNPDEIASFTSFVERFRSGDSQASDAISDSLLDMFSIAGTPEDAIEAVSKMNGLVDRFEFGTPHGLRDRESAIHYIGQSVVNELGE